MNATNFTDYEMLNNGDADLGDENVVKHYYTIVEDVMIFLSGVVSVACVCALCGAWAVLPRWRSLHAYIAINETVCGTLSNILFDEYFYALENIFGCGCRQLGSDRTAALFLLLSVCWSLCASAVAYVRLVRVQAAHCSHERKVVTAAACGTFLATMTAAWYFDEEFVAVVILLALLFLILCIFVVICVSVLCGRCAGAAAGAAAGAWSHALALAGVGLICQSMTLVYVLLLAGIAFADTDVSFYFAYALFLYRFVPSSLILLFNKKTRQLWKRYAQQKRNRDACRDFYL